MSFFRSEPMSLCRIILHRESAFNCLVELGYEGKVQFRNVFDGNAEANDQYNSEIKRCHEIRRMIGFLQQQMDDLNIQFVIYPDVDEDEVPEAGDLKVMETELQQVYQESSEISDNLELLKKQLKHLREYLQVMEKVNVFVGAKVGGGQAIMAWSDSVLRMLLKNEVSGVFSQEMHLSYFTGTIPVERFQAFETMMWRVCREFFILKHAELLNTEVKKEIWERKYIFMIFFVGQEYMKKITKICQGFGIQLFECSESLQERHTKSLEIKQEIEDLSIIIERSESHRFNVLLIASAELYIWRAKVNKMLKVYYELNRMSNIRRLHSSKYLQAECWIPTAELPNIQTDLIMGARRTAKGNARSMFIPMLNVISRDKLTDQDKPTYIVLNRFTRGFQNLINSYGIAAYQELNPAPYTIITFPFLFAVMFGDIGHGIIMFLFGLWMVVKEKNLEEKNRFARNQSEIWNILFAGRYVIALMGAFSIYTGFIYNDCFSKSFNLFGSSWRVNINKSTITSNQNIQLDPNSDSYLGAPYIFGMDPVWDASGENAITTSNSLKMKLALILGVTQMFFGYVLSALNFLHNKSYTDLLLVFLPQITFLSCIFVYLVFLIFYKWINYGGHEDAPYNSACAPSILIIFINMLLMKEATEPPEGCDTWMFDTQPYVQAVLLTVALLCIPVMFAGKPIYFMIQEKRIRKIKNETLKRARTRNTISDIRKSMIYDIDSPIYLEKSSIFNGDSAIGELWIHSGIHCIESVLGSVSHTASYLRLWALSLAHDQLSSVLWNMILKIGLSGKRGYLNSLVLYLLFYVWAILTVAILVVMEGLSAFLHTLRLHWVEFQSKFYSGTGEAFQPFHFEKSSPYEQEK